MFNPELEAVHAEVERLGAGEHAQFYVTQIRRNAEEAERLHDPLEGDPDAFTRILDELNGLRRSLQRSKLSQAKIVTKLDAISSEAKAFIEVTLSKDLGDKTDPMTLDYSQDANRVALIQAIANSREWVTGDSGPKRQRKLQAFSLQIARVYQEITSKKPGVGGNVYENDYRTPFERLWLAALQIVDPGSTTARAREIYRAATAKSEIRPLE